MTDWILVFMILASNVAPVTITNIPVTREQLCRDAGDQMVRDFAKSGRETIYSCVKIR